MKEFCSRVKDYGVHNPEPLRQHNLRILYQDLESFRPGLTDWAIGNLCGIGEPVKKRLSKKDVAQQNIERAEFYAAKLQEFLAENPQGCREEFVKYLGVNSRDYSKCARIKKIFYKLPKRKDALN